MTRCGSPGSLPFDPPSPRWHERDVAQTCVGRHGRHGGTPLGLRSKKDVAKLCDVTMCKYFLEFVWQNDVIHTLVEFGTESKALEIDRQRDVIHDLVESGTESQALDTVWQPHTFQAVVERMTKSHASKTALKNHALYALVEICTKQTVPP